MTVLSLFHPQTLTLKMRGKTVLIERSGDQLDLTFEDGLHREVPVFTATSGVFTLHVDGKRTSLTRTYRGTLTMTVRAGELRPIVSMETEAAVASVVQAEAVPGAPAEALRAQAVAARSFLLANLHPAAAADTCDTTQCQLVGGLPSPSSPAARATAATDHLILTWQPRPASVARVVAARWTPTCAGRTLAGHPRNAADYPFYAVSCSFCRTHPDRWMLPGGTPVPANEREREAWNRTHPGQQVPSLHVFAGRGEGSGHGMGLCQRGASALAAEGRSFRAILSHYYPNTTLTRLR